MSYLDNKQNALRPEKCNKNMNPSRNLKSRSFPPARKPRPGAVVIRSVAVPQGDGSVRIAPDWPVVVAEEISTTLAAHILGLSQRRVQAMIDEGKFVEGKDWTQPGGPRGRYFLKLAAVLARKQRRQ